MHSPSSLDYLLLVTLSMIFGMSFIFTSISVRTIPPTTVTALRLFVALLIIYPVMRIAGQRLPPPGKIWMYIFASGVLGTALPFWLISWGQVKVEAGLAAIFMAVIPLTTILLAQVFTEDERINRWKVIGVLLGFTGIVILMGVESLTNLGDETLRQLAILLAALCYASNNIVTRQLTALPKYSMTAALMIAACIVVIPASLVLEKPWNLDVSAESATAVIGLAILSTAIATLIILTIIDRGGATFVSQINFLVPLFGVLFSVILLQENLASAAYVALAVIIIALIVTRHGQRKN